MEPIIISALVLLCCALFVYCLNARHARDTYRQLYISHAEMATTRRDACDRLQDRVIELDEQLGFAQKKLENVGALQKALMAMRRRRTDLLNDYEAMAKRHIQEFEELAVEHFYGGEQEKRPRYTSQDWDDGTDLE